MFIIYLRIFLMHFQKAHTDFIKNDLNTLKCQYLLIDKYN